MTTSSKLLLAVFLGSAGHLAGAEFTGRWAGNATSTTGDVVPIHLTLSQSGDTLSGTVIAGNTDPIPTIRTLSRDDVLTFATESSSGQRTEFTLTFLVVGRPPADPRVELQGSAKTGAQESKVILYPVSDTSSDRVVVSSGLAPLHRVEPRYTDEAREARIAGSVLLQVEVAETGLVLKEGMRVVRTLGYGLDAAAIACVAQWRFRPAYKNGYAVKSPVSIEVNFRLPN